MNETVRDTIAKALYESHTAGNISFARDADVVLAALDGHLFTTEDARLMRMAIDWIASELRGQDIPAGEYVGTRTMLNELITRFDQYAVLVGTETPWLDAAS